MQELDKPHYGQLQGVGEGMAPTFLDFNFLLVAENKECYSPEQMLAMSTSTSSPLSSPLKMAVAPVPQPLQQLCNIIKAIGNIQISITYSSDRKVSYP